MPQIKTRLALRASIIRMTTLAVDDIHSAAADDTAQVHARDRNLPNLDVIDISSYQRNLSVDDFLKMKATGVKGIIVKITESTDYTSPNARTQVDNARKARLKVSAYHFARFSNENEARDEANYFADVASSMGFNKNDLLIDDLEANETKVGNVTSNARAFNDQLHNRRFNNSGLYTYKYYLNTSRLDTSFINKDHIWMAQYPYDPSATTIWNTEYGMWQWSSKVNFDRLSGNFDGSTDYSRIATRQDNPVENLAYQAPTNPFARQTGYFYDRSPENGGYRWYENRQLYTRFRYYMRTYYWFVDGVRQNAGWRHAWGLTYYTDNDGRAVQGQHVIDRKVHDFGTDRTYYERPVTGYLWDGSPANGRWRWYENGELYTRFRYYARTYYWFVDGVRQNAGWRHAWGLTYYTDNDGRAVQGKQEINGKVYDFGNDRTYYSR